MKTLHLKANKPVNNDYVTKDFWLAAYLVATNNKIKSYTKTDGVTRFTFSGSEKVDEQVAKYYTQEALVNPMAYSYAQKTLKSIIYDGCKMENVTNVEQSKETK
jgi:hypothetical protein